MKKSTTDTNPTCLEPESPDEFALSNPSHIWIEPTNCCNNRCRHCLHFYNNFGEDMDIDVYERIRCQVLQSVDRVELIGYGEPLIAKLFWKMFDDCAERGIEIYITSNGILLGNDDYVSKLVRNRVVLCLSIDGAHKESFEFVRPYIKWEKMLKTLETIHRNMVNAGAEKKCRLRFNFCAMKNNIADLPELVKLAHMYGAEEIAVLPLAGENVMAEVAGQSLHNSPELVCPAFTEALRLAVKHRVYLYIPGSFRRMILAKNKEFIKKSHFYFHYFGIIGAKLKNQGLKDSGQIILNKGKQFTINLKKRLKKSSARRDMLSYCYLPWNDSYFATDGGVFACCVMQKNLGNIREQNWTDIWNGQAYRNLRRTVHSWNPSGMCRYCALPSGINGGDEKAYDKYFNEYNRNVIPLNSPGLKFLDGFYQLELNESGNPLKISMKKRGIFRLNVSLIDACFLRLLICTLPPEYCLNPGCCQINGGIIEPFDNTVDNINFPLHAYKSGTLEVVLEMENMKKEDQDIHPISLSICGIEILTK